MLESMRFPIGIFTTIPQIILGMNVIFTRSICDLQDLHSNSKSVLFSYSHNIDYNNLLQIISEILYSKYQ